MRLANLVTHQLPCSVFSFSFEGCFWFFLLRTDTTSEYSDNLSGRGLVGQRIFFTFSPFESSLFLESYNFSGVMAAVSLALISLMINKIFQHFIKKIFTVII